MAIALTLILGLALAACSDDDGVDPGADQGVTPDQKVQADQKVTKDQKVGKDKGQDGSTKDMGVEAGTDATLDDAQADSAADSSTTTPDGSTSSCTLKLQGTLTLKNGSASVSGEVRSTDKGSQITMTSTKSCTKQSTQGFEHIYAVSLKAGTKYNVSLFHDSGYNAGFYVFTDCAKPETTCVFGKDEKYGSDQGEAGSFTPKTSGVHYVAVDTRYTPGATFSYGKYTLAINVLKKPANDTCKNAAAVTFPTGANTVTIAGNTALAVNDVSLTNTGCTKNTTGGNDVFYKLAVDPKYLYKLTLVTPGFNGALYTFTDCAKIASTCGTGMGADATTSTTETLAFTPKAAGTYYVGVDGRAAKDIGAYALKVERYSKPNNDTCKTPKLLTLTKGKVSVKGDTTAATSNVKLPSTGCTSNDTEGPDLFYKVKLTGGKTYSIKATPASGYDLAVYLLKGCTDPTKACLAGADASYSGSLEKVTYSPKATMDVIIGVDTSYASTSSLSSGKFTLDIEELVVPKNNSCAGATKMTWVAKKATIKGDTTSATNTINLAKTACTGNDTEGPDLFYKIDLVGGKSYKVKLTPATGYNASVYMLSKCDKTACVAGAESAYSGSAESFTYTPKTSGTYIVGVDTYYAASSSLASGKFTLDVEEYTPAKGETCTSATAMTWKGNKATITGDTSTAVNDLNMSGATCGGSTSSSTPGFDLFHRISLQANTKYLVTLTPASTFDAAVYIFNDCNKPKTSCFGVDDPIGSGKIGKVLFTPKTAGTYYIGVDSYSTSAKGKYTLTVEKAVAPANDKCVNAKLMTFSGTSASVTGDTSLASNVINLAATGCTKNDTEGPDRFYKVKLTAGKSYKVSLAPASGYDAAVYILDACKKTACKAGSDSGSSSTTESFIFKPTTTATYTVAVDSKYASSSSLSKGNYTLTVAEYKPQANDTCKTAKVVKLVAGKATVTDNKTMASNQMKKCGTTTMAASDLFYKFTPVSGKKYKITFKPLGTGGRFGVWDGNHNCDMAKVATACGVIGYSYVSGGSTASKTITATAGDIYFVADGLDSYYDTYKFSFDIAVQP